MIDSGRVIRRRLHKRRFVLLYAAKDLVELLLLLLLLGLLLSGLIELFDRVLSLLQSGVNVSLRILQEVRILLGYRRLLCIQLVELCLLLRSERRFRL